MVIYPFSFEYMPMGVPASGRPRRQLAGSATARRSAAGGFHGSSAGLRVTEVIGPFRVWACERAPTCPAILSIVSTVLGYCPNRPTRATRQISAGNRAGTPENVSAAARSVSWCARDAATHRRASDRSARLRVWGVPPPRAIRCPDPHRPGRRLAGVCRLDSTYPQPVAAGHLIATPAGAFAAASSGIHSVDRTTEQGDRRMTAPGRKPAPEDSTSPSPAQEPDAPSGDDVDEVLGGVLPEFGSA